MPLIKRRRVRPNGAPLPLWRRAAKRSTHLLSRTSSGNTNLGTTIGSSSQSRGASSSVVGGKPPVSSSATASLSVTPAPIGIGEEASEADIAATFTWSEFDDGRNPNLNNGSPPRRRYAETRPPSFDDIELSESLARIVWRPEPPAPTPARARDRETSRRVWRRLLRRDAVVDSLKRKDGTLTPTSQSNSASAMPRTLSGNRIFEADRHERFDDPEHTPRSSMDLEEPSMSSWDNWEPTSATPRSWRSVSSRSFQKRIDEPPKILAAIGRQMCMNDISHLVDAANSPCISYDRQIFDPASKLWRYVEADPPSGSRWELPIVSGGPNSLGSPVTTRSVPGSVIATPSLPTPAAMHAAAAKRKKPLSKAEVAAAARAIARRHRMVSHMHHNQHHGHNNHMHHGHGHSHHNQLTTRRPWSPAPSRPRTPVRAISGTISTRKLSTYSEDGTFMTSANNSNRGSYARRTTSNSNYFDDYNYSGNNNNNGGGGKRGRRLGTSNFERRQFSNYSEDGSMLLSASASTAVANSSSQRHGQKKLSGFIR